MYDSKISSNSLYHFTKSSDVIINILKNGFYPRAAQEDVSFMMPNYPEIIVAIPMVCFTDIPLENTDVHRAEYGRYGLALKKEWGIRTGLNPVGYILKESEADKAFNQMQKVVIDNAIQLDKDNIENPYLLETMSAIMNYAANIKIYSSDWEKDIKPYYDEREWRYIVPFKNSGVGIDGYSNRLIVEDENSREKIEQLNERMRIQYPLKFSFDDLQSIILPENSCVDEFIFKLQEANLTRDIESYIKKIVIF